MFRVNCIYTRCYSVIIKFENKVKLNILYPYSGYICIYGNLLCSC